MMDKPSTPAPITLAKAATAAGAPTILLADNISPHLAGGNMLVVKRGTDPAVVERFAREMWRTPKDTARSV